MDSLFHVIKRVSFTLCRAMAFGGEPQFNVRYDEAAARAFMLGNTVRTAYPQQPHFIFPHYPNDFPGGRGGSNGGRSGRGRRRCWPWVVGALILNVLVVCGTVLCVLFALKGLKSPLLCSGVSEDVAQSRHVGCVPCPEQVEGGRQKCCPMTNHEEPQKPITSVINDVTQSSETGRKDCGALFFLNEVEGDVKKEKREFQFSKPVVVRDWDSSGGSPRYRFPCVAYNKSTGEFTVDTPGFYVIYNHLAFEWQEQGTPSVIMEQRIRAKDPRGREPYTLASDKRAIQKDNPYVGYIPTYNSRITTVVYLHGGTVLTIEARPIELLMRINSYSSFGLFKL